MVRREVDLFLNVISVSFSATNRPKNMSAASVQKVTNETAHIRNIFMKTTVLCYHICPPFTGVEKNEQHLNIDYSFDHQTSLSKKKC
jgi:hypothetical protein